MNKDLLGKIIDSLGTMIDYADDGNLDRNDPDFKFFFNDLDKAKSLLNDLYKLYEKEV